MTLIFSHFNGSAEHYLRGWQPADNLWHNLLDHDIEVRTGPFGGYSMDWYDVFIFHGSPPRQALPLFMTAKRDNKKLVWNVSEDFWSLPPWYPGDIDLTICDWLRESADEIWVSTEHLRTVMGRGKVLPTLLSKKDWPDVTRTPNDKVRIVAAYSHRHEPEVEQTMSVFERLIDRYQDQVMCLFVGAAPFSASEPVGNVLVPHERYKGRLGYILPTNAVNYAKLMTNINGDLAVDALVDHPFNQAKCNLRLLDYSMAYMASVSGRDTDGLALVGDLYEGCCRLIEDENLRRQMGVAARVKVQLQWTWNCRAKRQLWMDAFREIAS